MTGGRSDDTALPPGLGQDLQPDPEEENNGDYGDDRDFGAAQRQEEIPSPVDFARDVLKVNLWSKQEEVLAALPRHQRVAVKSGNGLGKGFCAAVAVLWFLHYYNPAIVLSTAPTFRQVRHILWRQIRQLHRRATQVLDGKILDTRWELAEDRYALGFSADTADQFQGFHSPNMFIVVDEAEGVSDEIYEAIEAVMTSDGSRLLLIGNPTTVSGVFRRAFYEESSLYHNITISALDSPNVATGRVVIPGLTTARWVNERKNIWGEENPLYRARVLGEFPDQAADTLIKLSDIESATQKATPDGQPHSRKQKAGPQPEPTGTGTPEGTPLPSEDIILAVDVARFGTDRSVILRRQGDSVQEVRTFQGMDTMQLVGWVVAAIQEFEPSQVCIDEIGVGAGVVDRLREQGYRVRGINVARSARQSTLFANLRAEGYWKLRELFALGAIELPPDSQLMGELAALRYSYESQGRILMESKEAMRQRSLPSPDRADALMLAFLETGSGARVWT